MKKSNWWKSIASFLIVLFTMPLGHALMMIMEKTMPPRSSTLFCLLAQCGCGVSCFCHILVALGGSRDGVSIKLGLRLQEKVRRLSKPRYT